MSARTKSISPTFTTPRFGCRVVKEQAKGLQKLVGRDTKIHLISGVSGENVRDALFALTAEITKAREKARIERDGPDKSMFASSPLEKEN